jgi:hypothetical protein
MPLHNNAPSKDHGRYGAAFFVSPTVLKHSAHLQAQLTLTAVAEKAKKRQKM